MQGHTACSGCVRLVRLLLAEQGVEGAAAEGLLEGRTHSGPVLTTVSGGLAAVGYLTLTVMGKAPGGSPERQVFKSWTLVQA